MKKSQGTGKKTKKIKVDFPFYILQKAFPVIVKGIDSWEIKMW